jgi:hypothetical protein
MKKKELIDGLLTGIFCLIVAVIALGWLWGLVGGLCFGLFMYWLRLHIAKIQKEREAKLPPIPEIIVTDQSKNALVTNFVLVCYGLPSLAVGILELDGFFLFLGIATLLVGVFFMERKCFLQIIGKEFILKRDCLRLRKDRIFHLKDLKSVDVTFLGNLRLHFHDNKKVLLSSVGHYKLPETLGSMLVGSPRDLFYRFRQELLNRAQSAGQGSSEFSEIQKAARTLGQGVRWKFALEYLMALPIVLLVYSMLCNQRLENIKTGNPVLISQLDFEKTFRLYKGTKFENLKAEFESACDLHKDYHCRYAAYMATLAGEKEKSVKLMKIGCNGSDPRSCYNVYTEASSTKEEKRMAASVLDSTCSTEDSKSLPCCACYFEEKEKAQKK